MRNASQPGADLAYSNSVAGALAATGVHLEGTQTIGDSTATPRRRPALDREGPSTVLLALRFPGVVALVYSSLTSGHVQVGADHQVPGGNWSHLTCCFHPGDCCCQPSTQRVNLAGSFPGVVAPGTALLHLVPDAHMALRLHISHDNEAARFKSSSPYTPIRAVGILWSGMHMNIYPWHSPPLGVFCD
jgi:hypothetical protein